ncbi:hypothetical protein P8605_33900, partial [Streptomyces sp. T-3]|nr:hypothetical protein [Streptomyces sp. T-3]
MADTVTAVASLFIALVAVAATIWQARRSTRLAESSLALPVAAETFREFRSKEFRDHVHTLLDADDDVLRGTCFRELPPDLQRSAYEVCYYFEYMGVLTAFRLVRADVVIGTMSTQIVQVWEKMRPAVEAERTFRAGSLPRSAGVDFLPHFEHLVRLIK